MEEIKFWAARGGSASQVESWLLRKYAEKEKWKVPPNKTIQRIVRENKPYDPSADWQLAEADGEDAAIVLPVLAAMIEASEGRLTTISNAKAEWIVKLWRVAVDLPPWTIYELAHAYMLRRERQDATDDLDAFLAFAPWRSEEARNRYYGLGDILPDRLRLFRNDDGSFSVRESYDDITYVDLPTLSDLAPAASGETEQQKEKGR